MGAYIKKAWRYCTRNGVRRTFFAAIERMLEINNMRYEYKPPSKAQCKQQREQSQADGVMFSILVPAYETPPAFLRQMLDSVLGQTYPKWELVIVDAGKSSQVEDIVSEYAAKTLPPGARICYRRLKENAGISANTNEALALALGEYIGLLDHDDVLTPDALYEMAAQIAKGAKRGQAVRMLYSDEDKCDADGTHYVEPHKKEGFNLDLLLSNHYICHFFVMEAALMKRIGFRPAYDGAQDHKLALDAVAAIMQEAGDGAWREQIVHIPKVLYHWRCHSGSTASNPQSKRYAYEAGKRAVASFCETQGWKGVTVEDMPHLGFYRLKYAGNEGERNIFAARRDVGALGGLVICHGRIDGGRYGSDGTLYYKGLCHRFSGYMHKAVLMQEAEALDIRCIAVREELQPLLKEIKRHYHIDNKKEKDMPKEALRQASLEFARCARQKGYSLILDPAWRKRV